MARTNSEKLSELATGLDETGKNVAFTVDTLAELQAYDTSSISQGFELHQVARTSALIENSGGLRVWFADDRSAEVARDEVTTGQGDGGRWVAPASDRTGASGAWRLQGIAYPEHYGAVGDGVASGGIFSGTDDTAALQAWLYGNRNYFADPDKVYMAGNLIYPHHSGNDAFMHTSLTLAFANCTDTTFGMGEEYWYNNSQLVPRGPKMQGNRWVLYGNDHVDSAFKGAFFDADASFVASRCLDDGFVLTGTRRDGTTKISGTAVDNRIVLELHDNGGNGFRLIDAPKNKLTDSDLTIIVSEGNAGYDVNMEGAAGWKVNLHRNYASGGGVFLGLASAATHVHFGQGDSGSATPSGITGWGFYVQDILTADSFNQATGFVKLSGQLNFPVSCGALAGGVGNRGIQAADLNLATDQGYFYLQQGNPAIRFVVSGGVMSGDNWTSAFGTAACPFRFSSSAITASYCVSGVSIPALNSYISNTIVDGSGTPVLTISGGEITVRGGGHYRIDTEGAAATDDLDTINGLSPGESYTFSAANSSRTVVFKDGTGNIQASADLSLDAGADVIYGVTTTGSALICLPLGDNA